MTPSACRVDAITGPAIGAARFVYDGGDEIEVVTTPVFVEVACARCSGGDTVDLRNVVAQGAWRTLDDRQIAPSAREAFVEVFGLEWAQVGEDRFVRSPEWLPVYALAWRCDACAAEMVSAWCYGEYQPTRWSAHALGTSSALLASTPAGGEGAIG